MESICHALSMEGIVAITSSVVDGEDLHVLHFLLSSSPSVVEIITVHVLILDNCSVHHVDEALSDCGVITIYHVTL